MKKQEQARRLLYALSDVDDKYIEETAHWKKASDTHKRVVRFPNIIYSIGAVAACLVLVLLGSNILERKAPVVPEGQSEFDCNPIVEADSMSEAAALAGFELHFDQTSEPYTKQVITVLDRTIIEVSFQTQDGSDACYSIRKGKDEEDISGDYTEYPVIKTVVFGNIEVTLKGEDDLWQLAIWHKDGYSYAIEAQQHPLSTDALEQLIAGTT